MPSAVIEVCHAYTPEEESRLLAGVHACIVQAFCVSPVHRNLALHVHAPHRFVGRTDCPDPARLTHVTIYALPGRSIEAKRRLYALLVQHLQSFGIPPDCVLIRLIELPPENFGVRGGQALCDLELGYPIAV